MIWAIVRSPLLNRKDNIMRSCNSLKQNEHVVFNVWSDIYNHKIPMNGNVLYVDKQSKTVCVNYLYGYKSETEHVEYNDMLAVYNPDGKMMYFDNIYGCSDLLEGGITYSDKRRSIKTGI